ncbi:pilus assembly protein PilM, partial [Candidatus Dojkabacteria bacterium]|nr:pilus assembly protein PilM [Candidatus Dojkabacteria bacterium]
GRLVFSQSIGTGSDSFSKAIATDFNLQPAQASQYKMKYGVLPNQQDGGKIHNSIKPILEVVLNEIRKILGFIDTRLSYGSPQGIFLSGNGALLPGLPQYMQSTFQLPVSTLDPLNKVKLKGKVEDIRNHISPMGYSVAIGLGLKEE